MKATRKLLSILLTLLMLFNGIPRIHIHGGDSHAHEEEAHDEENHLLPPSIEVTWSDGLTLEAQASWEEDLHCEHCGGRIAEDWICSGGEHCSEDSDRSDCYEAWHCTDCGDCMDNEDDKCDECEKCL